jgi:hypothetical protein
LGFVPFHKNAKPRRYCEGNNPNILEYGREGENIYVERRVQKWRVHDDVLGIIRVSRTILERANTIWGNAEHKTYEERKEGPPLPGYSDHNVKKELYPITN